MPNHSTLASVAILTAAFLPARAHAQAPASAETYRLAEVAGAALPALIEEERSCREEVISGTLVLEPAGSWIMETSTREVCGSRIDPDQDRDRGTYTIAGDSLRFIDDDDDDDDADDRRDRDIDLDELSEGIRGDGSLTVRLRDGRTLLVFRR